MIPGRWLAVVIGFALLIVPKQTFSQSQDPEQNIVIRIDVNLIQVDAVVTDSKGRPVPDLKIEDFTVLQDGKPQKITNFSYIHAEAAEAPRVAAEKPAGRPGKSSPEQPALAVPLLEVRPSQVRRTVALIVDDLGLSFPSVVRVRESLRKWVDKDMRPGDLVAVLMTGGGIGSLQQFTADKRPLYAAIDQVSYNHMGRVGSSSISPVGDFFALDDGIKDERDRQLTLGSVGAIQSAVSGLRNIAGRKSVILFSENLGIIFGGENDSLVQDYLRRLSDEAIRSSVVIHAIDPRGVVYTGFTAEDRMSGIDAAGFGNIIGQRLQDYVDSQDGLVTVAKRTGGLFIQNDNNISRALEEVVRDGDSYYLLGYQPDEKVVKEMESGKPKYHDIKVKVNRKGLRVRTRSGFFSTPDSPREPTTIPGRIAQALYSPFKSGTLKMRLTTLFARTKNDKSCINGLLHFDTKDLTFVEEPDGWHKASLNITAATFDAAGLAIDFKDMPWSLMAKGATYESMLKNGVTFLMRVPVRKAGAYQMRVVLCDMENGVLGSARQFIEVPDVRKNKLALSGIVLAAEKFDPKGRMDQAEGVLATEDLKGTAAIRIFEPGETIAWAYQVLNAKPDKKHNPELQAYVRLFCNGREVYAGNPSKMAIDTPELPERLIASGRMEMKKASPGDYALQVIVADTSKEKKHRIAAQSIDFEVR